MNTGLKIKIARIKANKKQYEVANEVGITPQYLRKIESGLSVNPSKEVMEKISNALNLKVSELFFNED